MKALRILFRYFNTLRKVSGKKGLWWTAMAFFSSLTLSSAEYFVAISLQVLLAKLGLIQELDQFSFLTKILSTGGLLFICGFLVAAGFIRALATYFSGFSSSASKEHIVLSLRQLLFEAELTSENGGDFSHYSSASRITYQIAELIPNAGNFVLTTVQAFTSFSQMIFLFAALMTIAVQETLVVMLSFSVIAFITFSISRKVRKVARQPPIEQMNLMNSVQRVTRNRIFLYISKTTDTEFRKLVDASQRYHDATVVTARYVKLLGVVPPFFGVILLTAIIYLSQNIFGTSAQAVLPFLYLLLRFSQQTGAVSQQIGQLNSYLPQFTEGMVLAQNCRKKIEHVSQQKSGTKPEQAASPSIDAPAIEINGLSFAWEPSNPLFNNFSLSVGAGEQVAIVGPSGRGKSTLLYLILGLLQAKEGEILVDGLLPLKYLSNKDTRIGYVGAEPFLMEGTIEDNLLYGLDRKSYGHVEINQAIDRANLNSTIASLSGGLHHLLNENGEGLSAGQRQRLSLARALIRQPRLLILDEASANLDDATESQIAETLRELKGTVTTIIVSHRKGLVKFADKIIKL